MDELTNDFKESIFNNSKEIIGDYIEISIDSFINDGLLKDIPIVSSIVSVLKIGKNIQDRNLLKQTLTFINEFNNEKISDEKLLKYKMEIENDSQKCEKELGRILILLNGYIDKEKSTMLARLYKNYIMKKINWEEFCEYSETINRMYIQDIEILKEIYEEKILSNMDVANYRLDRLSSIGLIHVGFEGMLVTENSIDEGMNEFGKKFAKIIFKK